jgi:hypothetical protein
MYKAIRINLNENLLHYIDLATGATLVTRIHWIENFDDFDITIPFYFIQDTRRFPLLKIIHIENGIHTNNIDWVKNGF